MDDAAQRSLLLWVQSFHDSIAVDVGVTALTDLCDGVFLAKIMHKIDPEYLNMELINEQASGNWALKASNVKTLLRAIELFYHDELGQLCDANELIDAHLIAKESDAHEVARLVELVLGCAVQCPSRSEYIHPILQMGASEQASLMHLIENIMHRFQLASPSGSAARHSPVHSHSFSYISHDGESSESLSLQLTQALEKVSAMELRVLDMEREKRELTDRFEHALVDKQSLAAQLAALEQERDKLVSERQSTLTRDNKKIQQLVDGEVHALTLALDEKSEELTRVKRESTERLMVLENEVRRQADELDISRSKLATLAKLEASVAKYKKKLEEMNALRTQVKDLEIHNAQYLDKVLDLESTVKTMPTLKALVERYKNQVVDLETANVEAVSNNHVKDQKIRRLQEELDSALGGKEFLESQLDELRAQLASLQHAGHDDMAAVSSSGGSGMSADVLLGRDGSGSLRERIARLERENAQLKSGDANAEETHLASELDLALKAKESLQFALLQLKQQHEELQEQLRLAQQHSAPGTVSSQTSGAASATAAAAALSGHASASGVPLPGAASGPLAAGVTGVPGLAPAMGSVHDAQAAHLIGATGVVGALSHAPMGETVSSGVTAAQVAVYEEKIQKLVSPHPHQALLAALAAAVAHVRPGAWSEVVLEQIQVQLFSLLARVVGTVALVVSTTKARGAAAPGQADAEVVDSMRVTVAELTNRLKDKESVINELSEQRTKLENYTKKTLHAVQTKYMVAVSSHRNQINEKQERVDLLEKKLKEMRTSYMREQALMMSSFYEIGTEMQRRTMLPQSGQAHGAGSWLASKRTEERAKRRNL